MTILWNALAGVLSGIIGSMGLGGGGVLVLYLVLFLKMPQLQAQGINLLFFIPCAVVSLIIHCKNKLVQWRLAFPLMITGSVGVFIGFWASNKIPSHLLSKIFAVFILIIGLKELFSKGKRAKKKEPE